MNWKLSKRKRIDRQRPQ